MRLESAGLKYAAATYSVDHLHPFRFTLQMEATGQHPARIVDIRVGFSCHTFTRDATAEDAEVVPYLVRGYETRVLCPVRHGLSLSLPDIVRSLPERRCYFAGDDNYLTIGGNPQLAAAQEYRVFFDVRQVADPGAVLVYVQSAYAADKALGAPSGIRRKKVGFRVLVNHVLRGTHPTPPP